MTVIELYGQLCERIPGELSCEWDNDGLMCCPDRAKDVRKVLITLDVTDEAVAYAAEGGFDVIISHHPMIFKGLKAINEENYISAKAIKLIKSGISVMSFHTRLDAVGGGVNDVLATALGLENVNVFGNGDETIGRIGDLPCPVDAREFAERVKAALGAPFVLLGDAGLDVSRVAVLGGEGDDDIYAARAAGADTYVSGRLGYHNMTDAEGIGMNLIEAGHFYTENPVCPALRAMINEIAPDIECELFYSNTIKAI